MYIGTVPRECSIPPGAVIVEMKYCELCGSTFTRAFAPTVPHEQKENDRYVGTFTVVRRRDHGAKLCKQCRYKPMSIEEQAEILEKRQQEYIDALPNLDSLHMSAHPIRYSAESPTGRTCRTCMPRQAAMRRAEQARAVVMAAFRERGRLSVEELQNLIPECYSLPQVHTSLKGMRLSVRLVDRVPGAVKGAGLGIYVLPGVSKETVQ